MSLASLQERPADSLFGRLQHPWGRSSMSAQVLFSVTLRAIALASSKSLPSRDR
jgi:hypothetical protein